MCYLALYKEYAEELEILKAYIKSLKARSKDADFSEKDSIKRRVSILYTMYRDMKETTEYLKKRCEVTKK